MDQNTVNLLDSPLLDRVGHRGNCRGDLQHRDEIAILPALLPVCASVAQR